MKIQIKQWLLLLLCVVTITSCSKDDTSVNGGATQELELGMNALMFIQNPDMKIVNVKAIGQWTVSMPEEAQTWCKAESLENELRVTVQENTASSARETLLTLMCGSVRKTLPVRQSGTAPFIEFVKYTTHKGTMSFTEGERKEVIMRGDNTFCNIEVVANVPYEVESSVAWIKVATVTETRSEETTIAKFVIEQNIKVEERGTEIAFKQKGGDYYTYLPLTQGKNPGIPFELKEEYFTVTPESGKLKIEWNLPQNTVYDRMVFTYADKRTGNGELTKKVSFVNGGRIFIDNLLNRDGRYIFKVKAFNAENENLVINDGGFFLNTVACEKVPAWTEYKIALTENQLDVKRANSDADDPSKNNLLVDGNLGENDTNHKVEMSIKDDPIGMIINLSDDTPGPLYLRTINRWNEMSQAPYKFKVYYMEEDSEEWIPCHEEVDDIFNLQNKDGVWSTFNRSSLPAKNTAAMNDNRFYSTKKFGTDGINIKKIRYHVLNRANSSGAADYFSLTEIEVYYANGRVHDPENNLP